MANPINPQTGRPWSDQEMAYFRMLQQNAGDPNFADNAARYLTTVAKPNDQTGIPEYLQGADPYQVTGGTDLMQLALQQDIARQQADIARKSLDLSKGNAVGWVDGNATEEEKKRQDDIRRNPMNAALYEQERRGYRSGTGNEDPLMYQQLQGDKAFQAPTVTPTQPAGQVGGGGGTGGGNSSAPKSGGGTPVLAGPTSVPHAQGSITGANFNPRTGQYEFTTANGPAFSIDKASSGRMLAGTDNSKDPNLAVGGPGGGLTDYSRAGMTGAMQDLNKRIGSLTPEAAKAFAAYDASKTAGRMGGGPVDIPGYDGGNYGFKTPEEAIAFAKAMAPALQDYQKKLGATGGAPEGQLPRPGSPSEQQGLSRFGEALRRIAKVRDTARDIQNLKSAGTGNDTFQSPEWRKRLSDLQQILNINMKGGTGNYNDSLLATDKYKEDPTFAGAIDNLVGQAQGMDWQNPERVLNAYNPDWYKNFTNPSYDFSTPMPLKTGGDMVLSGAPHWIVNPMGQPVAALTEDGKPEQVKGKGGVEVVPLDPSRKAAYEARKKAVPGKQSGGKVKTNNELSRRTTTSKEVNARTTGAKPGDKRVDNGKTNNGRPAYPGADVPSHGVSDKDAASVRRVVRGPMMPVQTPLTRGPFGVGVSTLPVREANGAVMPYRETPMGGVAPVFPVAGHVMGDLASGLRALAAKGLDNPTKVYRDIRQNQGIDAAYNAYKQNTGYTAPNTSQPFNVGQQTTYKFNDLLPGGVVAGGTGGNAARDAFGAVIGGGRGVGPGQPGYVAPVSTQPVGGPKPMTPGTPILAGPDSGFDASGGNRVIGNETAPMARYGFDKNAPIDIAAHGATRGVKGMPGVQVAQPWKQAPRALMTRGTFGNQLLQSYWNATGAAPEDLADRGRAAMPGQAGSQRAFV